MTNAGVYQIEFDIQNENIFITNNQFFQFNDFFVKFIRNKDILVKTQSRVVYKVSSEHNLFFLSIDSNGITAYRSNISEEALENYNSFNNAINRISGDKSFQKGENLLAEGQINAQNKRDIKFIFYGKKSQLR